jgi:hypothetical protein
MVILVEDNAALWGLFAFPLLNCSRQASLFKPTLDRERVAGTTDAGDQPLRTQQQWEHLLPPQCYHFSRNGYSPCCSSGKEPQEVSLASPTNQLLKVSFLPGHFGGLLFLPSIVLSIYPRDRDLLSL